MVIKYLLFDCDNTLVLSERLAFEACADLTNELLAKHNIEARYTGESLLETFVGQNFRGMMVGLQQKHNFTMDPAELDSYVDKEVDKVVEKLLEKAEPCPNVIDELNKLKGKFPMAVVSTSAKPRVIASLLKTGMGEGKYWPDEHVYSAATSLNPPSSKPDPKIYLYACEQLGIKPDECITVEDSRSGATAAMRAGIPCIGYVGVYGIEEGEAKRAQMEKVLLEETKCKFIMNDWKEFPEILKKIDPTVKL
jgi:beta-phosphoglucomutase-like phosphatase (HAD superfamily)